jgi:3-hydroxyacyl-[acyl-carrier-protein] dehydratase
MRWFHIDRFEEVRKSEYARAVKGVTLGEDHIHDHFPGYPCMPPPLIIEALAQTAGILVGYSTDFTQKVILGKVAKAVFTSLAIPGDRLTLEAHITDVRTEGATCSCRASVEGRLVAEVELMFVNLDSFLTDQQRAAQPNFVFSENFQSLLRLNKLLPPALEGVTS